jgi:hydroxyethylthiazole kinase
MAGTSTDWGERAAQWLDAVRAKRPLVHNITNWVVTNIAANALLAIGASPVMAYSRREVADMARIASALALNMGTLDEPTVEAMRIAGDAAAQAGVPIVFDPVGVGATPYRNETAAELTDRLPIAVLRGNAGEMGVLLGAGGEVKGVDSVGAADDLPRAMQAYAKAHGCVVVATGPEDWATDGTRVLRLCNGHPLLAAITGSGCMLTAVIGGFVGAAGRRPEPNTVLEATAAAITAYNVAAELAAERASGPGTFQAALFDELYQLRPEDVRARARIEEVTSL